MELKAMIQAEMVKQLKEYIGETDDIVEYIENGTTFYDMLEILVNDLRNTEFLCEGIKLRQKELSERKQRLETKQETLRRIMLKAMELSGEKKAVLPEATISLSPTRLSVVILDESKLQPEYVKITKSPDKVAIKEALDAGHAVDGACLSNGGLTLTIRSK